MMPENQPPVKSSKLRRQEKPSMRVKDGRQQPFVWFPDELLPDFGAQMKPHGIAVYMALLKHLNRKSGACRPSHETIATMTGMSTRQVKVSLKRLEALGLIGITTRRPHTCLYEIFDLPKRSVNRHHLPIEDTVNRQVVPINRQVVPVQWAGGAYEPEVVEPEVEDQSTTTTPTPPQQPAPISETVVEVAHDFAVAPGEEAKTTDGSMASAGVRPFDAFADAYWSHKGRRKAQAEWDRQQLDSTLPDILTALSWQQQAALPEWPHVYLENKGWLDARPVSPSARPSVVDVWDVDADGQVVGPAVESGPRCRWEGCRQTPVHPCTHACERHTEETIRDSAANIAVCITQARKYGELNLCELVLDILTRDYVATAVHVLMQGLTLDRWLTCRADEVPTEGQLAHYLREDVCLMQWRAQPTECSLVRA